jgi:hypothetical protein
MSRKRVILQMIAAREMLQRVIKSRSPGVVQELSNPEELPLQLNDRPGMGDLVP